MRFAGALAVFVLLLGGCARKNRARVPAPPAPAPVPARIGSSETGIASWYGKPYDGRPSASGEIYDMLKLTAAHRTLPFNTWVEVTDLDNGKRVNVRINDRGPFVDRRIIDLSLAAARSIDMVGPGIARVRVKVIAPPADDRTEHAIEPPSEIPAGPEADHPIATPPAPAPIAPVPIAPAPTATLYSVQAGAFSNAGRARAFAASVHNQYKDAVVVESFASGHTVWRVLIARDLPFDDANRLASQVRTTLGDALVVSNP